MTGKRGSGQGPVSADLREALRPLERDDGGLRARAEDAGATEQIHLAQHTYTYEGRAELETAAPHAPRTRAM